jgi:hypothetical protein
MLPSRHPYRAGASSLHGLQQGDGLCGQTSLLLCSRLANQYDPVSRYCIPGCQP